jgi:hypothetical protein
VQECAIVEVEWKGKRSVRLIRRSCRAHQQQHDMAEWEGDRRMVVERSSREYKLYSNGSRIQLLQVTEMELHQSLG